MAPGSINASPNLILTGFMGTGKTTVGRAVARRLGRSFVDMDQVIEARVGRSIADIFARQGEAAFRAIEAELCRELAGRGGLVIATGGGTLVNRENRQVLASTGLVICLTADVEAILRRLDGLTDRPLLDAPDRRAHIEALLEARAAAYDVFPHRVDTTDLTEAQVAERVLTLWHHYRRSTQSIAIPTPGGGYDVLLGRGLLERAGELLKERGLSGRVAVVTDRTVGPLYAGRVLDALAAAGLSGLAIELPAGEGHKTLETVRRLYDAFLDAGLDRGDTVLALGGGVVGDTAGFAAATYMRGLPLVQAPTTLLAMVDAGIGGKVGVDLPRGKNLVGVFKQPVLTMADLSTLATLPVEEIRAGLAEVVKHGLIADPELFEMMEQGAFQVDEAGVGDNLSIVARAAAVKVAIVSEDPYEGGRRMVLNLGHTFAHALEACSGYAMRHGEAVAVGLVAAARLAADLGLCEAALPLRVETLLQGIGLPTRYQGPTPDSLWEAMAVDKKRRGRRLRFVLPEAIGRVVVREDVPREQVLEVLEELEEAG